MTKQWNYEISERLHDDKRDITITNRFFKKHFKKYSYRCNICGYDKGETFEKNLEKGTACACCTNKVVVVGINDIPTTDPWMIPFFIGEQEETKKYSSGSKQRILPVCPDCGKIKEKSLRIDHIYATHSIGCSCGDGKSYPQKFMRSILEQNNIFYEVEFSPIWAKGKRYDFRVDDKIIEVDGSFGHGVYSPQNAKLTAEETLEVDNWKDEQAILHGYKIFRIDARKSDMEYLKMSIQSALQNVIILDNVDWLECDKAGLKNIVKEVADYYMENKPIFASEIANVFKLTSSTIRKYLHKAKKQGWCDYDSQEARQRNVRNINNTHGAKKVNVYKDNVLLHQYFSASECSRRSKEDFHVQFNKRCISNVCLNKQKQHKGFTFKYVSEMGQPI